MSPASLLWFSFLMFFGFQDPVLVNPKIVTVVLENDRVRVLRVRYGAHDRLEMHSHPALVAVSVTPNSRRVFFPDGSHSDASAKAGEVQWREPVTHAVENLTDDPFENIEIEFKKTSGPGISRPPTVVRQGLEESSTPIPARLEPHHRVVFENQYVRILEVEIPPGDSTLFHTHSNDNLAVRLSAALSETQIQGEDWRASPVAMGSVSFTEGSKKPYTHRVKNVGTVVYHVIDVEFLP
jgi:hypothetical protein